MEKYTKTFYLFKHFSLVQLVKRFLFLGEKLQPTAFFQLKTVSHSITSMHKDLEATDVMTKHTFSKHQLVHNHVPHCFQFLPSPAKLIHQGR